MAEIRFENVSKSFGVVKVVEGLTLTIHDGEFFTFVGPSGCGKSTILNLIAGLEEVTGGRILFDGQPVNGLSPKDRDVAMVFQSYALYPHMTVFENIAFPLRMKKEQAGIIEGEVRRVASLIGLGDLLGRRPRELSGGQRQRVALARAIVRKPRVFLMDEPLSNLDARLRVETRAELKKLHRELGITTVYVTHDQAEAMSLSDRIAVLNEGVVQQAGSPREVYAKPANVFVGGFIGSLPMNFLPCRMSSGRPPSVECLGILLSPPVDLPVRGGECTAGVRPEDVVVSAAGVEGDVEVTVSVVEPAGSFNWVDALRGDVSVKGTAAPDENLEPGKAAYLRFSNEKVSLFDPTTGRRF
jgi:multiple sugar transport system ATP-binding protein